MNTLKKIKNVLNDIETYLKNFMPLPWCIWDIRFCCSTL